MQRQLVLFCLCFVSALLLFYSMVYVAASSTTSLSSPLAALSRLWTPLQPGEAGSASTKTPRPTFTPRQAAAVRPTATALATPTASGGSIDQRSSLAITGRAAAGAAQPAALNGVPIDQILVLPDAVRNSIASIYAKGQTLGRNPRVFTKVGDSTMVWPPFLAVFDDATAYKLGAYGALQSTVMYFSGSFGRTGVAVQKNLHSWGEFDTALADKAVCKAGEGPLACELRVSNASIAIIRLGVNDAYVPDAFETNMRKIVDTCLANGVIPILGTKPDRLEGPDNTINKIIYRLADRYSIPLWDYDLIAGTVPGKGLDEDKMHFLPGGPHDYTSPAALRWADSLEDLTGLMMLDAVYHELQPAK